MKTKIYYGRDKIGQFVCDGKRFTKWQVFVYKTKKIIRLALLGAFGLGVLSGTFFTGRITAEPVKVLAEKLVPVEVMPNIPVLERIAGCESGNAHKVKGQIVFKANTNGSIDIGRYQINSLWFPTATKMGLDLTKEEDNKKFAEWLFINKGSQPWSSSAKCWSK